MSVPKGKRNESSMQFLETANTIEKRAMEVCRKWPKSYTFIITQRTIGLASSVYEHAQKANAIIPKTEAERQERVTELLRALGANSAFSRKIERAYSMFPICGHKDGRSGNEESEKSNKLLEEFMGLCVDEEDALKGNLHYTRNLKLKEPNGQAAPAEEEQ